MTARWIGGMALALAVASPALAQQASLEARVRSVLAKAGPGVRFGLVVATPEGKEIVAIAPDDRFIPASNTKIFSTTVALTRLPDMTQPDAEGGASVALDGKDVVLTGHGDARLSSAADCVTDCLATLADAVAAEAKSVRDVIGDDTLFLDERWSAGMAWNNIPSRSGTAISALTLDDNELVFKLAPGAAGKPPVVDGIGYYTFDNRAVSAGAGANDFDYGRLPNMTVFRLTGSIARPATISVGIDDPAHYAAWRLRALLEARGVKVRGVVRARHRLAGDVRAAELPPLARLTPPPLIDDMKVTMKESQNLHADLFLRRVSAKTGSGAMADGVAAIRTMLTGIGVPRAAYDFSDGSGMSTYNRVSPRGVVTVLRWAQTQPWGTAWRATLPVAGVDGTLSRRFKGTALEGKLFAKTGSLNATHGLSGFFTATSGKTFVFSSYANDVPEGVAATAAVDAALVLIAAEN